MDWTEEDPTVGSREHAAPRARRGRPLEMSDAVLMERIRALARRPAGLVRIHMAHPAIYARARRMFGSWAEAVRAAGIDYSEVIDRARRRSMKTRRQRRKQRALHDLNSGDALTSR